MFVIAIVFVFAAIVFLVLGFAWREEGVMDARIATLRGERPVVEFRAEVTPSIGTRVFGPMAQSLGGTIEHLLPTRWLAYVRRRLVQAGQPVTPAGFLFALVLCEGTMVAFGFTMAVSSDATGGKFLLFMGVSAFFGVYLPRIWLENRVRHRQAAILKSLPDAFDLITTCVEAGLGLEAALQRVAEKTEGPFGEELTVAIHEVALGKLRRDALKELAERAGVPDLSTFINAVIQAESMGTSIATVLRVQAEQMRIKRRQRAEQLAQQAPVKMIFPLVLCIFPTLFIVILGPAGMSLYQLLIAKD